MIFLGRKHYFIFSKISFTIVTDKFFDILTILITEAVVQRCSVEKVFLEI